MARSTLDTELRSQIDSFLNELSALVKRTALESVHAALGNGVAPARRGPGRPRGTTKAAHPAARSDGKRTPEQVAADAERIASYVRANPGSRLEQIAAGLGTGSKELKLPVIKLLASKTLRKTGQKRGTQYFAGGSGATNATAAPKAKAKTKAKRGRKGRRKKA
jgi:hypothetical protein